MVRAHTSGNAPSEKDDWTTLRWRFQSSFSTMTRFWPKKARTLYICVGSWAEGRLCQRILSREAAEVDRLGREADSLRNVCRSRLSLRIALALATANSGVGLKKDVIVMMSAPCLRYSARCGRAAVEGEPVSPAPTGDGREQGTHC